MKGGLRIADRIERLLGDVGWVSFRHPWIVLVLVGLATAAAFGSARHLSINADLSELLPRTFASVRDLDELKTRFGGLGYITIVARGAEPEALRRFADEFAPKLAALDEIRYVDHRRPADFFVDRALYFLEREDLEKVRDDLREREAREKRRANPLFVDLEDEAPADAGPPLSVEAFAAEYGKRGELGWMSAQLGETHYLDAKTRTLAVLGKPKSLSLDLKASQALVAKVEALVAGVDRSRYGADFLIEVAGTYKKKVDQQELIQHDLGISSIVALVLIVAFLALHFRHVSAVVLLLVPLGIGVVWSYGFAGFAFGQLNILTGFIGAVLSGMGIENGIHLLGRFEGEWKRDVDPEAAVRATFGNTGRGVAVTVATTMVAFLGIALSEFRAFHEFGIIAAGSMLLFVVVFGTLLPALLALALRLGWKPRHVGHEATPAYVAWLIRSSRRIFLTAMGVLVVLGALAPFAEFNYNFRSLLSSHLRSFELDRTIDGLLGYSQNPVVVLTNTHEEELQVARELRRRSDALGKASTIQLVASSAEMVPEHQDEKLSLIEEIGRVVRRVRRDKLGDDEKKTLELVDRMVAAKPFTRAELPVEVTRQFEGIDPARGSGFVLVYAAVDLSDGARIKDLAQLVRGVPLAAGATAPVAGEAMIMADIFTMVSREAPYVLGFAIGLVFLSLWLMVGSLRASIVCILPAAATLVALGGLMPLTGVQLNYINIVMVPLFFGIGIDAGAHLATRMEGGRVFAPALAEIARGVSGSLLTNAFGFCSLVIADHSGLNSLGKLALLGLAVNLLAGVVALPAYVVWRLGVWHNEGGEAEGARESATPQPAEGA